MTVTRWGIIGPGAIAHNFADGLAQCDNGQLMAIASHSAERRATFGDRYGIAQDRRFDDYDAICAAEDVDAIYISTPHPFHAALSIRALRAGKHVLCEKPAGLMAGEVTAVTEVARAERKLFMEAFMYRCHPQIARLLEILATGRIGRVLHVRSAFGFAATFNPESRLYDPSLAGGGILDVGCYPVSLARLIAGEEPDHVTGTGTRAASGVDETAFALLRFPGGMTAECATSVSWNMENSAMITGTLGEIHLPDPWAPGRNAGPSDAEIHITVDGETEVEHIRSPRQIFSFEAEHASRLIAEGTTEASSPAMSFADSIGNARVLDQWRQAVGYTLPQETGAGLRVLPGCVPAACPPMPMRRINGVNGDISALVMGCDNKNTVGEGAIIWDAWMEAGGNAFDTGFVYGGGHHEAVLGNWMATRGVAQECQVIVKGAHSPYCTPRAIATQLSISLERLQLDHAPIYIMHRDNPDVPVGEFVTALNALCEAGTIGAFGGSNWSEARFQQANDYARTHGLRPMSILNNNLSLAVMEKPVWDGCVTSNTPETLSFLRQTGTAHFAWSAQARGYFLDPVLRARLDPEACFGSAANAERRARAEVLAAEKRVAPHNIAAAWVLSQAFPSFALIGPRSPGEIVSAMPAVAVTLTDAERDWLNLEGER